MSMWCRLPAGKRWIACPRPRRGLGFVLPTFFQICIEGPPGSRGYLLCPLGRSCGEGAGLRAEKAVLPRPERFRAYDSCLGCATHYLPGRMPLTVVLHSPGGEVIQTFSRPDREAADGTNPT